MPKEFNILKKQLGEMLKEAGLLTQEQLNLALDHQKKEKIKLGKYLVQEGDINEAQIVNMICKQLNLERYRPDRHYFQGDLSSILSAEFANKHNVVPLYRSGHLLTIVMSDPMDTETADAVERITGAEVETLISTERELNALLTNIYGSNIGSEFDDTVEHFDEPQFHTTDEEGEFLSAEEDLDVTSIQNLAEEAPVVRLVNTVLQQAIRENSSDIHINPEKTSVQIRFRMDGRLHHHRTAPKNMGLPIVSRIKILSNMDISTSRIPQDGRFTFRMDNKEINVRVSSIPTVYGENMVLRLLETKGEIYDLDFLGIRDHDREKIESLIVKPYGMILSTGPTGSGKTTTLYSILKRINKPDINIITLEDPVEYRIDNIRQIQLNEKAGMNFARGVRSILRQDPDVIMVGEIRDAETAGVAVQSALTGHRMLSTLHTNNAAGAVTRLMDMNVDPFLISSTLIVSIAQRLIRKLCPYCKEPFTPPLSALGYWGIEENLPQTNYMGAKGCFNCLNTGYRGRTGVFEVMVVDETIQEMIVDRASAQLIGRSAIRSGKMTTLKENGAEKIIEGITSFDEAASAVLI